MAIVRITEPATEPVSLALAKQHIGIESNDWDTLITLYIKAARNHVENTTHRIIAESQFDLVLDKFPDDAIEIRTRNLLSIDSVKYDDANGDEQTLDAASYTKDLANGWVVLNEASTWPTLLDAVNAVRVRFTAGYEDGSVPAPLVVATLLQAAQSFEFRESDSADGLASVPSGFAALVGPYRIPVIA